MESVIVAVSLTCVVVLIDEQSIAAGSFTFVSEGISIKVSIADINASLKGIISVRA